MKISYTIDDRVKQQALFLYQQGLSAQEVKDNLQLTQSIRQIQRWMHDAGISRSMKDAFKIAVSKGRVHYHKNPNKLKRKVISIKDRFIVLTRDNFKCVKCGATAKDSRLEVDHIDNNPNNNTLDNFQTLCEECNKGKAHMNHPYFQEGYKSYEKEPHRE